MVKRLSCKEMMEILGVGLDTVKEYRSNVYCKVKEAGYKDIFDCAMFSGIMPEE